MSKLLRIGQRAIIESQKNRGGLALFTASFFGGEGSDVPALI